MIDCSRNAVMNIKYVKKFAELIKNMGYNTLMLYTEDTYEVNENPLFGYMRGRYTKDELKDLDKYCSSIGIELIPCIQTLAHLNCIFKWSEYDCIRDCDDILLIDEEKTYKLIDNIFSTLSECFSSKKIHIGMDEAGRVGTGKYQDLHGNKDRYELINNHLHKVCEMAEKYGLEPMIWSDMFVRFALNTNNYYTKNAEDISNKSDLPYNSSLVYWDYYSTDYSHYIDMIKVNKAFGRKVYFAGGAWAWESFAPKNEFSIKAATAAIKACRDLDIDGQFFTIWGDDGAECTPFAVLPALMYNAEISNGNDNICDIKLKFKKLTGCDFDSFMMLDKFNLPGGKHTSAFSHGSNPCKYLFYNDFFMGLNDYRCTENDGCFYEKLAKDIQNIEYNEDYSLMFDAYVKLADVLSVKSYLGVRTRNAYQSNNIEEMKNIIKDYSVVIEKLKAFHLSYQKLWLTINKPHGFDIQDIRIGGLIQRAESCKKRLLEYINGDVNEIPELAERILEAEPGIHWSRISTPNVVTHSL